MYQRHAKRVLQTLEAPSISSLLREKYYGYCQLEVIFPLYIIYGTKMKQIYFLKILSKKCNSTKLPFYFHLKKFNKTLQI